MDQLRSIEYRGYTTYEIDSLVNSGQAYYMGHGSGREGAYNWIDNWFDNLKNTINRQFHGKPGVAIRERMLLQNQALHAVRKVKEDAEAKRLAILYKDR